MKHLIRKKIQSRKLLPDDPWGYKTRVSNLFHSGRETTPAVLFADYDKDGVANVFDCQPKNWRKQDMTEDERREEMSKHRNRLRNPRSKEEEEMIKEAFEKARARKKTYG
jgi:hypothetical protein